MHAARSRAAWRLAREQHGVLTRRDLEGLGFSPEAIDHRVETGRLRLISRGLYAVGRPELTPHGRWMAVGFPLPLTKRHVLGCEVDFFFPGHKLIVETDGLRYHRTPAQQARMVKRDQEHVAGGYRVIRFTHRQIAHSPGEVTKLLRRML
jgi:hypothetical protein